MMRDADTQCARLAVRSALGLLQTLIVMGAAMFLSAWSLRYWQGWVFLAVFGLAVAPITIYLLKHDPALLQRRLKAGPAGEKEKSQKIIQAFAGVAFIGFFVVSGIDHRFGWSRVSVPLIVTGDASVVLGLLLVFFVFQENSFTSGTIEVGEGQRVVSTGLYRVLRHPMYSGALLMMIGVPLALGSLWALLFVIPMVAVLIFRLLDEERFLSVQLPGYAEYCQHTRFRLIPWVY
jgi:protein-S-isoprenylcysteine O-methyltransferase Ste14